jgi:hypothetical protein
MKPLNVLLVSYSFPPLGGTGVMRAASLARYFPGENIRLDVLTARNASAVGTDPTLLKEIPEEVTIHQTLALDLPFGIKKWIKPLIAGKKAPAGDSAAKTPAGKPNFIKRAVQDFLQPDPQVTWLPVLTRAARRIIRKRNIDVVIVTVCPFSSMILIERLRKEFPRLTTIVDFRDEWITTTFDLVSFLTHASERTRAIAQRAEAGAVTNATAIVAVTEAARREIRKRYPQEPDSKFQLIPNGFDSTRLRLSASSREPRRGGKIIVTHVGTIYASTEPATLIQALQSLPEEVKSQFKLRFIGHIEEARFRDALLQLGDMVELKGFLPQNQALTAMNETDYVLLINHDPLNVGGKFYDYVGGGKPILGTVHPQGETRRLFDELRAGWWAGNRDVEGIRQLFIDAAARGDSLQDEFRPDTGKIAQYERKALAKRYAALLHSIVDGKHEYDPPASLVESVGTGD